MFFMPWKNDYRIVVILYVYVYVYEDEDEDESGFMVNDGYVYEDR